MLRPDSLCAHSNPCGPVTAVSAVVVSADMTTTVPGWRTAWGSAITQCSWPTWRCSWWCFCGACTWHGGFPQRPGWGGGGAGSRHPPGVERARLPLQGPRTLSQMAGPPGVPGAKLPTTHPPALGPCPPPSLQVWPPLLPALGALAAVQWAPVCHLPAAVTLLPSGQPALGLAPLPGGQQHHHLGVHLLTPYRLPPPALRQPLRPRPDPQPGPLLLWMALGVLGDPLG